MGSRSGSLHQRRHPAQAAPIDRPGVTTRVRQTHPCGLTFVLAFLFTALPLAARPADAVFGPGESLTLKITYAHLLAGRATLEVSAGEQGGRPVLRFETRAKSEGVFAWLLRYKVDDRTVATWEPASGCSLGIVKKLREGRAVRDQVVTIDPATRTAMVEDPKIREKQFPVEPCVLDVLSALFVTRVRGVPEAEPLTLPVFDNGKAYALRVRFLGRERLDLPPPLGKKFPTIVVEPLLLEGTGLFVKEGRLKIWLTDDGRRIPVRLRTKVPIGSVSGDLERYQPPDPGPRAVYGDPRDAKMPTVE